MTLMEALPYIQEFQGAIFVIKYGGNAMASDELKKAVMGDIALLQHVGINPVVVHGGGPEITEAMRKAKIKPLFVRGLRYTDERTMRIVKRVSRRINSEIQKMLRAQHCRAEDLTLVESQQKSKSLGLVGKVKGVGKTALLKKIKSGVIPVISPIGKCRGQWHNINADTVAAGVAEALQAEKLTILTNVEGVFEKGRLISHLSIKDANTGIKKGVISKGMIPKVQACVRAVKKGVGKAHLIDGTFKHSLLLEIFTDAGVGTEIVKDADK